MSDHHHPTEADVQRVTDLLSREEFRWFHARSDLAGARTFLITAAMIVAVMAVAAAWPNPLTVLLACVLLGNRMLGLAVLMHDAGHGGLFRSRALNRLVGRWICGPLVFSDLDGYARKHTRHHQSAGSPDDPDLSNYVHYAVTRDSFRRKILRDLTLQTGVKTILGTWSVLGWPARGRIVLAQAALLALVAVLGHPWLYLLWLGSFLTSYMLIARLRQAAEHAVVPDLSDPDPRKHTRTTLASWWERLTLAPNYVNFHLEHHLLPAVPPHKLRRLHLLLAERGFYGEGVDIAPGYRDVVSRLTVAPSATR
ncbi:MAG: fatty acid desaturase [Acidobacteria bacterium]|nr:MAG: fatty acid desaturase [Acidobacteriota bacterium]REK03178.1 MAG: fatty acid desaturase [Acidobacteriota bacterium]